MNHMTNANKQGWDRLAEIHVKTYRKKAWHYNGMGDTTDPTFLAPTASYEWDWTLREVVTALCDAGLWIEFCAERKLPRVKLVRCKKGNNRQGNFLPNPKSLP